MALLAVLVAILAINFGESRELRPTEHGLPFQNLPARSPEMTSFFGEDNSLPEKKPPPPEILDTSDNATSPETWWRGPTPRKNNVRNALLIATVVCGGTGVVLLLAAAFLFAVHCYRQRSESLAATNGDNNCANQSTSVSATPTVTAAKISDGKMTV